MHLSDSPGLSKNKNLAKSFLQHAHNVAASRVTSLEGLQIISRKPELISVNQHVKEHMDYLKTHRNVQLCSHIYASDVIFLTKTGLIHSDDDDTYKIPGFEVSYRNNQLWNQTTRPPHRLISYVRDTFQILGHETQISQNYESIFLCLQHSYLPIPVQLDLLPFIPVSICRLYKEF